MSSPTISECATRAGFRAITIGPVCARALREGVEGSVRSVFERSFYLTLNGTWICVGPPGLGAGPLNILCMPDTAGRSMPALVGPGACVRFADDVLYVGASVAIACAAAARWHPQPPPSVHAAVRAGLAAFAAALPQRLPSEGLGQLLCVPAGAGHSVSPALRSAQAPAAYLSELIAGAAGGGVPHVNAERLAPLLGLGPGLTPSGDDFLGGALVALSLLEHIALRDAIWAALQPSIDIRTNEVSAAHLAAAAEGFGSAALHDVLEAVLSENTGAMRACIDALAAIGHTSGWDAMAGAIAVLDAAVRRS